MSDNQAESEALRRVRVILADYASGARGATSALIAIEAAVTTDPPISSPGEPLPEYDQHDHPQDCGGECG